MTEKILGKIDVGWIVFHVLNKKYYRLYNECSYYDEKRRMFLDKEDMYETLYINSAAVCIVSTVAAIIFVFVAWLVPIDCKTKVAYFKQQSEYVEMAVENGTELENIAITQTVIEQNEWLAYAKASLEVYGIWSGYYGSDLEELTPIVIER